MLLVREDWPIVSERAMAHPMSHSFSFARAASVATLATVALGTFLFYNMNVINKHWNEADKSRFLARYEGSQLGEAAHSVLARGRQRGTQPLGIERESRGRVEQRRVHAARSPA